MAFHHPPPDNDLDEYWFAVAVAYPERGVYGVHDVTVKDVIRAGESEFGPGKGRGVDGDGVKAEDWKVDTKLTANRLVLTSEDKDLPKHIAPLVGAHALAFH